MSTIQPTIQPIMSRQYRSERFDLAGDIAASGGARLSFRQGHGRPITHAVSHDLAARQGRVPVTARTSNINPAMAGEDAATPGATSVVTVNDPEEGQVYEAESDAPTAINRLIMPAAIGIGIGLILAACSKRE